MGFASLRRKTAFYERIPANSERPGRPVADRALNRDHPTSSSDLAAALRSASPRNTVLSSLASREVVPVWLWAQQHQNEDEYSQSRRVRLSICRVYRGDPSLPQP